MENTGIVNQCTWIQEVGACMGKPASELKVGDVLGWNYGHTSTVIALLGGTPTKVDIQEEWVKSDGSKDSGVRRMKKDRIVAIVTDGKFNVVNLPKWAL